MIGVPHFRGYILTLGRSTKYKVTPKRLLRSQIKEVSYLMGDYRGLGFGSVLWGQGRMISESVEFYSTISDETIKLLGGI